MRFAFGKNCNSNRVEESLEEGAAAVGKFGAEGKTASEAEALGIR